LMLPRDECGQRPLNEWLRVRAGATSIALQVRWAKHAVVAARENWHDSPLRPTDDHASLKLLHVTHTQNCWRSHRI